MFAGERIPMAKEAVNKVIDTLTWSDHATVVLFSDDARAYTSTLRAMTDGAKVAMKEPAPWSITGSQQNGPSTVRTSS